MQKTTMRALCIALEGELDHHNTETIRLQLDRAIARSRGNLILDFAHVTLMDSSGIGLLIGRYKKLKEKGMRLFVKNVNPYVDKLFRMSGLYNIIEKIS